MKNIDAKYLKEIFEEKEIKNLLDLFDKDVKDNDLIDELIKIAESKDD